MLYQNSKPIFWTNTSLEKPDAYLIRQYYDAYWVELGINNTTVTMTSDTLTFNLNSNNSLFNLSNKWYKFIDNNNHVFYYFLQKFELKGATYVITLTIDLWSTYIMKHFDSGNMPDDILNSPPPQVLFKQKQMSNANIMNKNVSKLTWMTNLFNSHDKLHLLTNSYINNYQSPAYKPNNNQTPWYTQQQIQEPNSTGTMTNINYNSFLYKVDLISGTEQNVPEYDLPTATFIAFSLVSAPNNNLTTSDEPGSWAWWQTVTQTTHYDLDMVTLPFDMNDGNAFIGSASGSNLFPNYQPYNKDSQLWAGVSEWEWTGNSNSAIQNNPQTQVYFVGYAGALIDYAFPCLPTSYSPTTGWDNNANGGKPLLQNLSNYTEQDVINWISNQSIAWMPTHKSFTTLNNQIDWSENFCFTGIELLFPYLFNFHSFTFSYMGEHHDVNYSNFKTILWMFVAYGYTYSFVPNYPTLLLNVFISTQASNISFNHVIGSFNFMNSNIPSTLSVSNNFLYQNKAIIRTAEYGLFSQLAGSLMDGIPNMSSAVAPWTEAFAATKILLNMGDSVASFMDNYGPAKIAQLKRSNTLTSHGTNNGMLTDIFILNENFLTEYSYVKIANEVAKYGYPYDRWEYLWKWYIKQYHNYVRIEEGMEKIFAVDVPEEYVVRCIEILKKGVIIWSNLFTMENNEDVETTNYFYKPMYFDSQSILDTSNGLENSWDWMTPSYLLTLFYNFESPNQWGMWKDNI